MAGYTHADLEAEGLTDFRVFLCYVWLYLGLPKPTPVQLDIAYTLQHGPRRFIIQAFRGVGKSWITVAFVVWCLLLDPELKIMVVSANQGLSDAFSKFCKQIINGMPLLQHLSAGPGQSDSNILFEVGPARDSRDPSVKSVGIYGQLTGSRADIVVFDDVEVPKNSYTAVLRERLSELVKEADAVVKPGGRIFYLGTPQTEATLYNRLIKRGYEIFIWPSEIPKSTDSYFGRLAGFIMKLIAGGAAVKSPVDPMRFDAADLAERRLSYGDAGYALQFLLDTNPSDVEKHPLKLSDLLVMDLDPDLTPVKLMWSRDREYVIQDLQSGGFDGDVLHRPFWRSEEMSKYTGTVMAVDPSGQGKDETAYAIVRFSHGQLYWVASGGFRDGFGESTLQAIGAAAARYKVSHYIDETNYGGGMFTSLITPYLKKSGVMHINPEEWDGWSRGQKELRMLDTLEPLFKSHRIVVDRTVIEQDARVQAETQDYSVVYQITRMSRVKGALRNEDRLEALAMACGFWTSRLDRDQDRILKNVQSAAIDEELRKFVRGVSKRGNFSGFKYQRNR